jgi:hypothetical protein
MGQININRATGQLGRTQPTEDAVICMVISGAAVAGKIALGTPTQIFGSAALTQYGITASNNPLAFKEIKDFYSKAGEGAEFNFLLVSDATSLATICDKTQEIGKKLIDASNGRAVILMVSRKVPSGYSATITTGLDADVWAAITKANEIIDLYAKENTPLCVCLPGLGFAIATVGNVPNRSTLSNDSVAVNIYCEKNDGLPSMGILAGWLAKHQVHQNIGRVASGKLTDTAFLPDATAANATSVKNARTALENTGLLFPIKVGGKSGYFFNDDPTMTAIDSDYSSISWNRVMNKVHRIGYDILTEKLNDEVDIDPSTGKIDSAVASDWESQVENAIRKQMITPSNNKKTEINGVNCVVDVNSDIVNDKVDASISIVRKGQAKTINVKIGYTTTT